MPCKIECLGFWGRKQATDDAWGGKAWKRFLFCILIIITNMDHRKHPRPYLNPKLEKPDPEPYIRNQARVSSLLRNLSGIGGRACRFQQQRA